jgi:uncharacterized protein involved in outer membrane biogenesis
VGTDAQEKVSSAARRHGWRVALVVALAAAALLAGLLTAAAQGLLTKPITSLISSGLGRELAADGGVRLHFGSVIRVTADGLRLANSAWAVPLDMLRARSVTIEIESGSLLRDTVVVRKLLADGVELNLQRNARGEGNWTFRLHPKAPSTVLPVVFEAVSIRGARVAIAGPHLVRPLHLSLASVEQQEDAAGMLLLRATGTADATPLELQVASGPFAGLVSARNFSVKARGRLGDIALGLDARIDSLATPADTELALNIAAPQASYLASHLGLRSLGSGPVALTLAVSPGPAGTGVRARLNGQVGEFDVTAQGALAMKHGTPAFSVQGQVAGPDLARVGGLAGLQGLPAESFRLRVDASRSGPTLLVRQATLELSDARIEADGALVPVPQLSGSELAIKAKAADIAALARRFRLALALRGPLELTGKLRLARPRELQADLRGTTDYGIFTAAGPIQLASGGGGTRLAFTVAGADLAPLAAALRLPDPPSGAFKGKGEVEWTRAGLLLRAVSFGGGGEAVSIAGKLGRPAFGPGADLQFDVSGPSAARLAGRFGYAGFPAERYRATGRIQRQPDRTVLSAVNAEIAGGRLQLDGTLGAAPGLAGTNLAFSVSGPALADYAGLLPDVHLPRGAFRASGQLLRTESVLRLDKLHLAVGGASAIVSADLDVPLARHSLRFALDATVPEPADLLADPALAAKLGKHLQLSASGARTGATWSIERLQASSALGMLSMQGDLVILPKLSTPGTQVQLRAPSLRALGRAFDRHWPDLPVELHGRMSRSEQELKLAGLGGRLGGTAFTGSFAARGLPGKPDLDVEATFAQLDLDRYLHPPAAARPAGKSTAAQSPTVRGRVIPDTEVSMPELGAYSGRFAVHAGRLRAWGSDLTDFELQATLRDGRLQVDPLGAKGPGGSVRLAGALAPKGKGVTMQLTGGGNDLVLQLVPFGIGGADASRYSARVELQASGSRWSELAATLNGRVRLVGRGGRMRNSLVLASGSGFVQQLLTGLNPMATRQPTTEVDCSALLLRAKDGIVTTDPALVLRTREVDILSAGAIDLRTETIDFNFKIRARTGLGFGISQLVNPYVKVNGTLGKPGVTLDPTGALVNGSAAVATAGLSVVATTLWDRFVHESDPCGAAVRESDRRAAPHAGGPAQP